VENCICDCGRRACDSDFADALRANRIDVVVLFVNPNGINLADICIYGNVIFGKIIVDPPPEPLVHYSLLVKCHADAPHHAADKLAAGSFRVQNSACSKTTDHSRHFNLSQIRIHANLGKLRSKCVH